MSLTVFQTKLVRAVPQLVQDNINVFNQAANGTIVLGNGDILKDTVETMTLGIIDGLVTDRNAYAPVGTPADARVIARMLTNRIGTSAKVGPVAITNSIMKKIETDVNAVAGEIAAQATEAVIQHYIKAAVGAGTAAISTSDGIGTGANKKPMAIYTQAARKDGVGGRKFPTLADFPLAGALFGDQASRIVSWFMDGVQWANFIAHQAIPSAEQVFAIGNLNVMQDGLGRRVIVSDAVGASAGADTILGLVPGAIAVETNGVSMAADQVVNGENLERWWRGDFDFNIAVKGYRVTSAFRSTIEGTVSPTLAQLRDKTNWELDKGQVDQKPVNNKGDDQKAPTRGIKETAGVLLKLTATTA